MTPHLHRTRTRTIRRQTLTESRAPIHMPTWTQIARHAHEPRHAVHSPFGRPKAAFFCANPTGNRASIQPTARRHNGRSGETRGLRSWWRAGDGVIPPTSGLQAELPLRRLHRDCSPLYTPDRMRERSSHRPRLLAASPPFLASRGAPAVLLSTKLRTSTATRSFEQQTTPLVGLTGMQSAEKWLLPFNLANTTERCRASKTPNSYKLLLHPSHSQSPGDRRG